MASPSIPPLRFHSLSRKMRQATNEAGAPVRTQLHLVTPSGVIRSVDLTDGELARLTAGAAACLAEIVTTKLLS